MNNTKAVDVRIHDVSPELSSSAEILEKNESIDKKLLRFLTVRVKKFDLETNYFSKKDESEIIYASVRFPDEIVDTFDMTSEEKNSMLNKWENKFQESKKYSTIKELTSKNIPVILSAYRMAAIKKNS